LSAIRKAEWESLASKHLKDRQVILHTDAAKSYKAKVLGMLHDKVIHGKKRVKVRGKFKWQAPAYVRLVKHTCPKTGKTVVVKPGNYPDCRSGMGISERARSDQSACQSWFCQFACAIAICPV